MLTHALAAAMLLQTVPPPLLPTDVLAPDWQAIPDDEVMIVTLKDGRTVHIRLAARFAPQHVANIRKLVAARWWDGTSVYRVQDNWVTQWGDATEKKPLPADVIEQPAAEFDGQPFTVAQRLSRADAYSRASGITADGWPMASDGTTGWLTHCYGTVGVARDVAPSTGSGAELFTPIGTPARRLDRNYTVIGRIIEGMGVMASMPRSEAKMGFYATEAERTPILSVRLVSDLPAGQRPHFEYRRADNVRFAAMVAARENPKPPMIGLGGVDVCDVPLAVRRVGAP